MRYSVAIRDHLWMKASSSLLIAAIFAPFAAFILFAATRMPMSFDDAFNATVPLNLSRGSGYATSFAGIRPFDPSISSGAAFLAPAALPIAAFGADMQWPMLYTAALCLTLYLFLLRSLHVHAPHAALATAVLVPFMLWQGKTDIVVMEDILPAAPFGYWYQLLGNLPGVLALVLAMSLLLERVPMTVKRSITIVLLIVFAVNAKLMHIIALVGMVVTWAVLPPDRADTTPRTRARLRRIAFASCLVAAGWFGLRLNRVLAWLFLDGEAFRNFITNESAAMLAESGAARLLSTPLSALPAVLGESILWNGLRAVPFLGDVLQAPMTVAVLFAIAMGARRSSGKSSLSRLALVLLAGVAAQFIWWVGKPFSPNRHLTSVAGVACFAVGCGFGLSWLRLRDETAATYRQRCILWTTGVALLCVAGAPSLFAALSGWTELREHRNQQLGAAAVLERLADKYPDAVFCGSGWWVPRELTYLAPAGTKYCSVNDVRPNTPGTRILMLSGNLWQLGKERVRAASARCTSPIEKVGRFEFRGCDGFRP